MLSIYQLYVVGFMNGILTVFFDVAYQSYLPSLVDRKQIVEGNSKLEISRSAAQIVGPSVSGVLIALVSAPIAIVADSISYIGSACGVFLIRKAEPPPEVHAEGKRPGMAGEIRIGLRYVLGHPYLRMIAGATATSNLFSNIVFSILILYAANELHLGSEQLGFAFGIGSLGSLLGAVIANRVASIIGVGPAIVLSIALGGPGILLFAIAPHDAGALPYLAGAIFITSVSALVYNINQVSFRQAITPPRMQGRMNATMRFIVWGTIPLGQIIGGQLGARFGLPTAIWVGAIGSCTPFLFVLFSPVRSLREMPAPLEEAPAPATEIEIGEALDEGPHAVGSSAPLTRPAGGDALLDDDR